MATSFVSFGVQSRTFDHFYRFKVESDHSLTLKIYDLFRKRVVNASLPLAVLDPQVQEALAAGRAHDLLQRFIDRNLVPEPYLPRIPQVDREKSIQDLQQLIVNLKQGVLPLESQDIARFTCPITLEIFRDPVMDEHGHTFEREAIERVIASGGSCPTNRQSILSLTPNRNVREAIDEWRRQDPIPTFALFKAAEAQTVLAERNLTRAAEFTEEREYTDALACYSRAFRHTSDWRHYVALPELFAVMGHPEKVALANLYLAKYQLQDGQEAEAIATLERFKEIPAQPVRVDSLLVELYRAVRKIQKAIELAIQSAIPLAESNPAAAIAFYKQAIDSDPCQWEVYLRLLPLLQNPADRAHVLLTGACHAVERQEYQRARDFCQQAEACDNHFFIDRLLHLDLLNRQSQYPQVKEKLLTLARSFEEQNLTHQEVKTYKILTRIEYCPDYYQKIVAGYERLGKEERVNAWMRAWLKILIEREEWKAAETLAQRALTKVGPSIALYESLETIYTHWQGHQLCDLWGKLGRAYEAGQQISQAERIYRQAFERFQTFEHAIALGDVLKKQNKIGQSVQTYYEAASVALLDDQLDNLSLCLRNIRQIDPRMQHLDLGQRMILLTQSRILEEVGRRQFTERRSLHLLEEPERSQILASEEAVRTEILKQSGVLPIPAAFGVAKWTKYFGDVGTEPPLPPNIRAILDGPCPIWPGQKVKDTHMLVLIPQMVNGVPFSLNTLGELVRAPKQGQYATQYNLSNSWKDAIAEHGPKLAGPSHWVLMTKTALPGSTNKTYADQTQQVQTLSQTALVTYEVPTLLDAATCVFMERVRFGTYLFDKDPWIRCQEQTKGYRLMIGAFAASGLRVYDGGLHVGVDGAHAHVGVPALRKFC